MVSITDPWTILDRSQVMEFITAGNPTTEQIALFGDATTGLATFIDGITKSVSTMNIGMFGTNDFYFFYMKFKPTQDYITAGTSF